jgi:hypothetical protein
MGRIVTPWFLLSEFTAYRTVSATVAAFPTGSCFPSSV